MGLVGASLQSMPFGKAEPYLIYATFGDIEVNKSWRVIDCLIDEV